jgi:hypothetical protein
MGAILLIQDYRRRLSLVRVLQFKG